MMGITWLRARSALLVAIRRRHERPPALHLPDQPLIFEEPERLTDGGAAQIKLGDERTLRRQPPGVYAFGDALAQDGRHLDVQRIRAVEVDVPHSSDAR